MIAPGAAGFRFNGETISANAPATSGVYAIYNQDQYIYLGEGQDIRARLLAHLDGDNLCILRHRPTGFAIETVAANHRVARQDALILKLAPRCNQRLG